MSPIVRQAGEEQRRAADPGAHVFVEANAGSGKTRVLVDRVTRLLLRDAAPEHILCLTYTKAAAGEMKDRLFARLGEWSTKPDEDLRKALSELGADSAADADSLAKARRLFARALETPGGLKIQTIHAFCEALIRRFPIEAGAPPGFEVADDAAAAEAAAAARRRLAAASLEDEAIAGALDQVIARGVTALDQLFSFAAFNRHALRASFADGGAADRLRTALGVAGAPGAQEFKAEFLDRLDRSALGAARTALAEGGKQDQGRADKLALLLAAQSPDEGWRALEALVLTQQGSPVARRYTKPFSEAHPALASAVDACFDQAYAALDRLRAIECAEASLAAQTLTACWIDAYEAELARASKLDFSDLIERARALLLDAEAAEWVRYKMDGGVSHILVDEAQDTAPEQWELIAALAEEFFAGQGASDGRERTVFCVGDEKQSIYSFQGADPARFVEEGRRLEERAGAARQPFARPAMAVSFRSSPDVLKAVDLAFADIAAAPETKFQGGEAAPDAEDSVPPFQSYLGHLAAREACPGSVELWPAIPVPPKIEDEDPLAPVDSERQDSARNQLATGLAEEIAAMIERGDAVWEEVVDENGRRFEERPAEAGDIIVLVGKRKGGFFEELIRQLKRLGVPVAGADRMVLREQAAVEDLLSLLRFLVCPEDDLSLAELLKSPLFHPAGRQGALIDDDALFDLSIDRQGPLWTRLQGSGDPRFSEARSALSALLARADLDPPFTLLAEFLQGSSATGESRLARIIARLGEEARDPVNEFLSRALAHESEGGPGLARFLAEAENDAGQIKREMEAASGRVRVMTVHASKGLEAPIVILPDTTQCPRPRNEGGFFLEPGCGLVWSPRKAADPPLATRLREEAARRDQAEYLRLLYVALTRARDRLIVCGWNHGRSPGKVDEASWHQRLEQAWSSAPGAMEIETRFGQGWRLGAAPRALGRGEGEGAERITLPDWALQRAPQEAPAPRPAAPSRIFDRDGEEPPALSPLAGEESGRFRRGALIHKLLQTLPDAPIERREAMMTRYLDAQTDLEPGQAEAIAAETRRILDHPDFAPLFGPEGRAEVAVSGWAPGLPEGVRVHGVIDRLIVTDHEVLILDYKTNRPPPERLEDAPRLYLAQMAAYRALLKAMHKDKRVRCGLLWTDAARLMTLPDDLLERAIDRVDNAPDAANALDADPPAS